MSGIFGLYNMGAYQAGIGGRGWVIYSLAVCLAFTVAAVLLD